MLNYIDQISEYWGFPAGTHGHACRIEMDTADGPDQVFSATIGKFIELEAKRAVSAFNDGKHAAYAELIAAGLQLPCPVCDRPMGGARRLDKDLLMCESCRYKP